MSGVQKRRPMLNDPGQLDPRQPANWGPADSLPLARARNNQSLLQTWREAHNLPSEIEEAAYEIENVYRAIVSGLWTKTAKYGEYTSPGADTDLPTRIAIARRDRFNPWKDAMSLLYKKKGLPVQEVVIDALIEGRSLREIDATRRWRKGTASTMVRWGLWEYAVMAGWAKNHPLKETVLGSKHTCCLNRFQQKGRRLC